MLAVPPGITGRPAILPGRERRLGSKCIPAAEARGEPPASGSLSCCGGSLRLRLRGELLQARLIALLHRLLALQQAVLRLQRALLRALRPQAVRLLRLQFLHLLLQAIDAALAIGG